MNEEALRAAVVEEDSSVTWGKLARQFHVLDESVRLHLPRLSKKYRLSLWVLHTLLEVHKRQRLSACVSLSSL